MRNWPARDARTPYQRFEAHGVGTSPTPTIFPDVVWSAMPFPVRLTVYATHLVVDRPIDQPQEPLAVLPTELLAAAYPTDVPGGQDVVVLLSDGSWTTMRVGGGAPAAARTLADVISACIGRPAALGG